MNWNDLFKRTDVDYKDPSPCGLLKKDIQDIAEKFRSHLKMKHGDDIFDSIDNLGGRIHYVDFFDNTSGSLFVHAEGDFDVLLPNCSSPKRDIFTLAHELGHYFLHTKAGSCPIIAVRDAKPERLEWEANWFAVAMLMPEKEFRKATKDFDGDTGELAYTFGVSKNAVDVRKQALERE